MLVLMSTYDRIGEHENRLHPQVFVKHSMTVDILGCSIAVYPHDRRCCLATELSSI
jgi:hypothetical protein